MTLTRKKMKRPLHGDRVDKRCGCILWREGTQTEGPFYSAHSIYSPLASHAPGSKLSYSERSPRTACLSIHCLLAWQFFTARKSLYIIGMSTALSKPLFLLFHSHPAMENSWGGFDISVMNLKAALKTLFKCFFPRRNKPDSFSICHRERWFSIHLALWEESCNNFGMWDRSEGARVTNG